MIGQSWTDKVESACLGRGLQLTALRRDVCTILAAAEQPLGAYAIIEKLAAAQNRNVAPPTVYRALDFLVENGFVVKIESRQAYVACDHLEHHHARHGLVFSCSRCGRANEVDSVAVEHAIDAIADTLSFKVERKVVEVEGVCADCRGKAVGTTSN